VGAPFAYGRGQYGIAAPWQPSTLEAIAWADILGDDSLLPLTRAQAVGIPAVSRGLQLITNAAASCPIKAAQGDVEVPAPTWAYRTDSAAQVPPQVRTALIVDDLVMGGWSLCLHTRGTVLDRVPPHLWRFAADGSGTVELDTGDGAWRAVEASAAVLIKGPNDGLLTRTKTLRGALDVERAWTRAVRNPSPHTVLQQVTDDDLTDDEIDGVLEAWVSARRSEDGAVSFLPASLNASVIGQLVPDLLTEARNAAAVDIARHMGLPAVALDAGPVQSSMTYANAQTQGGLAVAVQGVTPYLNAIGWRLSMDDVVPRGTRIYLDSSDLYATFEAMTRTGTETRD
jgi:hypothetical protein